MAPVTVAAGKLTLACADLDARPLFWTDDSRRRHGYEPAVAAALAERLGLELQWQFLRWAEFGPAVQNGAADAIWCGCAITPERERQFLFSRPYAIFNESVLVRRGQAVAGPADLRGFNVGAIAGSTNMDLAESWPGCERFGFDGTSDDVFADMINALRRGEIDAVVDDEPAFGGLAVDPDLEIAFTHPSRNRWGAALHPDASQLKSALDSALSDMINDGSLRRIWQDWLGHIEYPVIESNSG